MYQKKMSKFAFIKQAYYKQIKKFNTKQLNQL